jgi:Uma2 family endonuclease
MSTAVRHHISLEEFMARPDREDNQREELIEGELIVSPGAKVWHAAIVRALRLRLTSFEQQGYVLSNDFSCILGNRPCRFPIWR